MAPIDPLRVEIAELSLIHTIPQRGATERVDVVGRATDGREVVLSMRVDQLDALVKALASTVRR